MIIKDENNAVNASIDSERSNGGGVNPATGGKKAAAPVRKIDFTEEWLQAVWKRKDIKNNSVRTSKYTWWSFLPRNLFEQFSTKMANLYFLVIMFMQMIDRISISNGQPAMLAPLSFVIIISMIKDGFEDYKRYKEDRSENENTTEVFNKESK